MLITEFDFELPEELIAQEPPEARDASRMLVLDRSNATYSDEAFTAFPDFLRDGDCLVINNTKVFPARLYGETETGARIEIFLVEETPDGSWSALARPAKRLKTGKQIVFGAGFSAEVVGKEDSGRVILRFESKGGFEETVDQMGETPLPPYIKRAAGGSDSDRERYQTLYAKERGAIAAPTAGLHFTDAVFEKIRNKEIEIVEITLHVGYGTFERVRVIDLDEHRVSTERFDISEDAANRLSDAKRAGRRLVAVGTTTTRALETASASDGSFRQGKQASDLTIVPGYRFKAVDALLTNFHLPKSSLLVLVSAFAGHSLVLSAYKHAVDERYRFYSYGDCMLIT